MTSRAFLEYPYEELIQELSIQTGRTPFYGDLLFRSLYGGKTSPSPQGQAFLEELLQDPLPVPKIQQAVEGTLKFSLNLGGFVEAVLIPMARHMTLCLSSQLGCAFGCLFCNTGRGGFQRNLSTGEILQQVLVAKEVLGVKNLRNIVFMGMGEPLDNFSSVIRGIDILSDSRGLAIPKRRISLSTAGHCEGIRRLSALCKGPGDYQTLHLSVSLHSAREETRRRLMPITRRYPLSELREVLLASPYAQRKDGLYIEYLIIPGVSNAPSDLRALVAFLKGMKARVNLIPYNPIPQAPWRSPREEELQRVWEYLRERGFSCRTRQSRGESLMAACGQLGDPPPPLPSN